MRSVRHYFSTLDATDKLAYGAILAAIVVAALVCFGWKALAAILVLAIAARIALPPVASPVASPVAASAPIDIPSGPLPDWVDVHAETGAASLAVTYLPIPIPPAPAPEVRIVVDQSAADAWERKAREWCAAYEYVSDQLDGAIAARKIAEYRPVEIVVDEAGAKCWERKAREWCAAYDYFADRCEELQAAALVTDRTIWEEQVKVYELSGQLKKEQSRNDKLTAKLQELHARRAAARLKRIGTLARRLDLAERRGSIRNWVRRYGGIDSRSHAFVAATGYKDRKEAIANGFPKECLPRSGGQALDILAMEFEGNGHFTTPGNRHATDYLLELIQSGAVDHAYDSGERYELAGEIEELHREADADTFNVAEFAA